MKRTSLPLQEPSPAPSPHGSESSSGSAGATSSAGSRSISSFGSISSAGSSDESRGEARPPLPLHPDSIRAARRTPAPGTPLFYLGKERELQQEIEAFSGAEHGTSRFHELRAKLDCLPERYQPRVLVALTNKIGELPPQDRLPNFRAMAIRAAGLHPENRDAMKAAMVVQVGLMPPLDSFAAFKIRAMYCVDQIPRQADWQEPAFTTHLDELPAEEQLPAVHAALNITSQWQPEHRKVIVGMLTEIVPAMAGNHMDALRTTLDAAATLPQRDYGNQLRTMVNRLDLFPEAVRGEASVELRGRIAQLRQRQEQER